jgi:hypothetical protein
LLPEPDEVVVDDFVGFQDGDRGGDCNLRSRQMDGDGSAKEGLALDTNLLAIEGRETRNQSRGDAAEQRIGGRRILVFSLGISDYNSHALIRQRSQHIRGAHTRYVTGLPHSPIPAHTL